MKHLQAADPKVLNRGGGFASETMFEFYRGFYYQCTKVEHCYEKDVLGEDGATVIKFGTYLTNTSSGPKVGVKRKGEA